MRIVSQKNTNLIAPPWLPALLLILVQVLSGLRDIPQGTFFLIFLQERLGLAPLTISTIVAAAQVAGMLTALLGGGALTARFGSKWVIACGLVLSALGSLAFQTTALGLLVPLWIAGGAGLALTTIGGASYLTRIGGRGALGVLAAFYALSMTIGGALGSPLAGWIITRYGFGAFSWTALGISAAAIALAALAMPLFRDPVVPPFSLELVWAGLTSTLRQPNARFIAALRALATCFYGMLGVLIPLLLNQLSGSKQVVAAYGAANLVVASAAQLLAGRAADRWGARRPTLAAYSALILAGLGLALFSNFSWGLFAFGVLGIAAAWSLSTLMYVWVSDGIPQASHPAAFSLLHAVWSLSMIAGSLLGSGLLSLWSGLPFLLGGLLNLAALFLVPAYYRRAAARPAASGA